MCLMETNYKYDYLILGTGNSALTLGALLAKAGKKVCMLEAHDIPGGYAQSFKWGDFYFCGQVHYLWGCGPGGKIYEFLKKIGLEKELTFQLHNPDGYDRMAMPDGKIVGIPYGFDHLIENIDKAYPGQRDTVYKFTEILKTLREEMRHFPERKLRWWEYPLKVWQFLNLLKYRNKTLQDVFTECNLSKEVQAVLAANAADFMLPPEKLAIFAYVGLFCGYGTGAYYATKHYKNYFETIAQSITAERGCHIFYETEVIKINTEGNRVTSVETKDGRTFTARTIICNIDPQRASYMIGREKFTPKYLKKLTYNYSVSSIMIYLGLKDIDLKKYGLGNSNIWHMEQWDMNQIWKDQARHDFSKPFLFISLPTQHSKAPGVAPQGMEIMEVGTYCEYDYFKQLKDKDYAEYEAAKMALADRLLDIVEEKYVPGLRNHIVTKVVGSPTSNEDWVWAPKGTSYGEPVTPWQIGLYRLKQESPFENFYWCNATAGYAGIYGTTGNGVELYMKLTGDQFFDISKGPSDEEAALWARKEALSQSHSQ